MDDDLTRMSKERLSRKCGSFAPASARAPRQHGQELSWHHPQLWSSLPEPIDPDIAVPPWPKFLRGCVKYREALDREPPDAPVLDEDDKGVIRSAVDSEGSYAIAASVS